METNRRAGEILTGAEGLYRLERQIGKGGMGTVWEAYSLLTRSYVAVKCMHEGSTNSVRFLRETRMLRSLSHRNIVRFIDCGCTDDDTPFLVLERLYGETLANRLRTYGPLEPRTALQIVRVVASALAEAHAKGFVHRDLKPANVFLHDEHDTNGKEAEVVLLDFGIAKDLGSSNETATVLGCVVGSPGYISPEQLRGGPVDARTDIFCVGLLVYELIEGKRLLDKDDARDPRQLQAKLLTVPLLFRERRVPRTIAALVMSCLEYDPAKRGSSAAEIVQELTLVLDTPSMWSSEVEMASTTLSPVPPTVTFPQLTVPSTNRPVAKTNPAPEHLALPERVAHDLRPDLTHQLLRHQLSVMVVAMAAIVVVVVLSNRGCSLVVPSPDPTPPTPASSSPPPPPSLPPPPPPNATAPMTKPAPSATHRPSLKQLKAPDEAVRMVTTNPHKTEPKTVASAEASPPPLPSASTTPDVPPEEQPWRGDLPPEDTRAVGWE